MNLKHGRQWQNNGFETPVYIFFPIKKNSLKRTPILHWRIYFYLDDVGEVKSHYFCKACFNPVNSSTFNQTKEHIHFFYLSNRAAISCREVKVNDIWISRFINQDIFFSDIVM